MGGSGAGTGGGAGTRGAGGGLAGTAGGGGGATPIMVRLSEAGTGAFGDARGPSGGGAAGVAFGFVTRNEWPHLGQRIFRPVGGTRRSSIWYGALHDSHSTFSIGPRERITQPRRDVFVQ
jgi:hypothetical protein